MAGKSAILAAVIKACDIEDQKKGEDRQDFLARVIKTINGLKDKDYDALPEEVLDWYEAAADVIDANKKNKKNDNIPDFPDLEAEEEDPGRRRRRGSDDEKGTKATSDPSAIKLKTEVTVTKKNGRQVTGKLVEREKDCIVLEVDGKDKEIDLDDIETIAQVNDKGAASADEPTTREPAKGDKVKLTNKRGKEFTGTITSITDDEIVLDTEDGEEDFSRDRVENIVILGAAKAEAATTRRRAEPEADKEPAKDEKAGRASTKANGGVSIGQRIKELIAANIAASKEDIKKLLDKEGLDYRPNTLDLGYSEAHKLIDALKASGVLKK